MLNLNKAQKQIILAVKIILFGALSWFFLHQLFYSGVNTTLTILSVLALVIWGIILAISSLLIEKKVIIYLAFALSLLSFFIFFNGSEEVFGEAREVLYYFIVLALIFLTLIWYRSRVRKEKKSKTKLYFWYIFKRGLPLTFTLICLLTSLAYYFSPSLGGVSDVEFKLPRDLFNAVMTPLGSLIKTRLPLYDNDMSVDELLTMFVFTTGDELSDLSFRPSPDLYDIIQSKGISIETLDINELLNDEEIVMLLREEIRKQVNSSSQAQLTKQRNEFSQKLNIEITGNETLEDVLYKLVNTQINSAGGTYKKYIPIAIAIGLFFSLRILVIILIPLIVLLSCLTIKLLITLGFANIEKKAIEAEILEL